MYLHTKMRGSLRVDAPSLFTFCHVSGPGFSISWKKWLLRFEDLLVSLNIDDKHWQKSLLLFYGGNELIYIPFTLHQQMLQWKTL